MKKESAAILIKTASLEFEKYANRILIPYDLTHTQFKILMRLYIERPLTVRQIDLEQHFSMTNPTVTGILQNLEKKNLIKRVINPQDSRSKVIGLTKKAFEMKEELLQLAETLEAELLKNLDEREKKQLIRLLKKMLKKDKHSIR